MRNIYLLTLIVTLCITGCSKNDSDTIEPISLSYGRDNVSEFDNESRLISVTPFIDATTPLYINGGDGNYAIASSNEEVVVAVFDGKTIQFKPVAVGTATVLIKDGSGEQYNLSIKVAYLKQTYAVASTTCIVTGDNITVGDKKELQDKVKAASVIKRYELTFTNEDNSLGTARLYNTQSGGESYKEYDFKNEQINKVVNDIKVFAQMTLKSTPEYAWYVTSTIQLKANMLPRPQYSFVMDLTETYRADYPAMEHVYEIQTLAGE